MADESGATRSFEEIPSPYSDPLLKKAMENLRNLRKEAFGRPAATFMAGVSKATASTSHILDVLATELSKKTGMSRGGIFKNIEDEYTRQYQRFKEQGVSEETALGKAQQVIYEGLGEAAVEVPKLVASGPAALPVWGAIGGASEAIEQGSSPLVGAATGAVQGAVLKGVLKGASKLPSGAREATGGAAFGLPALLQELQKPPEERDYATVAGQTIVGGALMFRGKPELKGLRGRVPGLSMGEVPESIARYNEASQRLSQLWQRFAPSSGRPQEAGDIYDSYLSEAGGRFQIKNSREYKEATRDLESAEKELQTSGVPKGYVFSNGRYIQKNNFKLPGLTTEIVDEPTIGPRKPGVEAEVPPSKPETVGERLTREAVAKTEPMPEKVEAIFKKNGLVPKGFSKGNGVYNYQDKSGSDGFIEAEGFSEKALTDQIKRNAGRETPAPLGIPHTLKAEIGSALKQKDLGDEYVNRVMGFVNQHGGMPKEPEMRAEQIRIADQVVRASEKWEAKRGQPQSIFGIKTKGKSTEDVLNPWVSNRYAFAQAELKTGVPGLYHESHFITDKGAAYHYEIKEGLPKYFKNSGIDPTMADPKQEPLIKTVLDSNDPKVRQEAWNQMSEDGKRTHKLANNLLQGQGARDIRYIEWYMWNKRTSDALKTLDVLNSKVKKTENDVKKIGVLEEKLNNFLPKNATISDMREIDRLSETEGEQAVLDKLSTSKWGTRKHYYMSERDWSDIGDNLINAMVPSESIFPKEPSSAMPSMIPGAAHTRTGKTLFDQGAFFPHLFNHLYRVQMTARMIKDVARISDKFMQTNPTGEDVRLFKRNIKNMLGYGEEVSKPVKLAEQANRGFWRTFPLVVTRVVPFSVRNADQSLAFGFGQINAVEGLKAITRITLGGRSEALKEDTGKYYKSLISQKGPIYHSYQMLQQEQAATVGNKKLIKASDTIGELIPWSDEFGRAICTFPVAYTVAENAVTDLRSGKIGYNKFLRRTNVSNFHPIQHQEIIDLLKNGKDREAQFRIAEYVTENVHFKYKIPERAGVEQTRAGRVLMGLYNYPRGAGEAFYQNGLKPFINHVEQKNWNGAYISARGLAGTIAGFLAAAQLANRLLGKRGKHGEYDILDTFLGYGPGNIGLNQIQDIWADFQKAEDLTRSGNLDKAVDVVGNRVAWFMPFVNDAVNLYEGINDKAGVKAMSLLRGTLEGNMRKVGKNVKRETAVTWHNWLTEKGQHIAFGTNENPQQDRRDEARRKRKSSTPITKDELLNRLRQAQRH